ncbi:TspO/MBR family protein [Phormidium tenue]|uniref:TspO protein n=1 Tax=Phormidium tenue NIES-30 TaxID=549789 RepID=A0A1U7J8T3_9CYAN|nr:tryptophan-rich sensory protein [Phormidium tenue]MBD2231286.1 tryptophan-rich sensory protein [Phormidium tenue FACHB-1052]OKH49645.1 TspO protein [Phormidium tenue NIES-30]
MFPTWLVIAVVGAAIASASSLLGSRDIKWFKRQRRPDWLTFEFAIPIVWTVVFICGGWSAYIVWKQTQSWWFMAGYIVLELLIVSYTPVMCKLQNLRAGTAIGAAGFVFGLLLALLVTQVDAKAFFLLLPFLLWSPVGTLITWQMTKLNPGQ